MFNNYKFPRMQSNVLFYPLTIDKLEWNKINEMDTSPSINITADSNDIYSQINYIEDSLFINGNNYLDSILDPNITIRTKPPGVAYSDSNYKFKNDNDNYMCIENKLYSLTGSPRTCATEQYSHTVLVTPPLDSNNNYIDLSTIPITDITSNEVTIKFFVKFLGFTNLPSAQLTTFNSLDNEFYFYKYGTAFSIVIRKNTSNTYSLKLYNSTNGVVATVNDFESRLGKWTFIALSYSDYSSDSDVNAYYPPKINWQVGNSSPTINPGTYNGVNNVSDLLTLIIPKEVTALWTRLMISYNYFTGFMGIYSNSGATEGILFDDLKKNSTADKKDIYTGSSWTNCLNNTYFDNLTNIKYNCVDDYDFVIQEENNNYNCTFTGLDDGACFSTPKDSCPLGFFDNSDDYCSCSNVDKKLMLISKNDNRPVCRSKIYIVFIIDFNFISIFYINSFLLK